MRTSMTVEEVYAWSAYFQLKNEREEKAYKEAQQKAQYRGLR